MINKIKQLFKKKYRIIDTCNIFKIQSKRWYGSWEDEVYKKNNIFYTYESGQWFDIKEIFESLTLTKINYKEK